MTNLNYSNASWQTLNPEWHELLVLKPIFDNHSMLEKRHLTIEVHDQEEGVVIGVGVIPLRDAFLQIGDMVEFKTIITAFEEPRGYITGKISVRVN